MDYNSFNARMYINKTKFEQIFPKGFVNEVGISYLDNRHSISMKKVIKICIKYNITYSEYQQLESLYLAKLDRKIKISASWKEHPLGNSPRG